ncbi:ABC-type transport auxiliary lipoprotein family protein [Motilimonas cestriensis]|uniref:ABC-type transport auxiliary lipoprotein family protein n=1 Tax=Motilimonas cestriensis TaxID=2742685 RepID=A0ABS8WBP1_9GAMM|nr:ABC-type transport auxiliary lipoprotein family protein [Motilimonas cestriensis]MCE2595900.1 ABC-type transport auxiliary lipoprotein family protein [Motilimonas cestriensis]
MKQLNLAVIAILSASLMGCSQTPTLPSQYYALGADDLVVAAIAPRSRGTLVLKPVELPDYLNNSGVVMQLDDNQVHIAEQHLWAGALNQQLDRLSNEAMALHLPQWSVVESAKFYPESGDQYWILSISVNRFQGRLEGVAVASGRWNLVAPNGKEVKDERFNYQLDVPSKDYPGIVEKLKENWLTLSHDIALQLNQAAQ